MATPLTADRIVAALKAEGVTVAEHAGWRTHNRNSVGAWGPVNGILIHHTAGTSSLGIVYSGRSDLPGPLAHTHLSKKGVATMVSAGRANHAGKAAKNAFNALVAESSTHPKPAASSGTVDGNAHLYGIEIENRGDGKDPYPAAQYDAAVRWAAALCRAHGWSADSVAGHKETSIEGKVDPSFGMDAFRAKVDERLQHPASWNPSSSTDEPEEDDVTLTAADIDKVATAVVAKLLAGDSLVREIWLTDNVVKNPNPATAKANGYIAPATGLNNIEIVTRRTETKLDAMLAALQTKEA
ncbi:N-acetylmuramoyl-L-alanine amidase [Streptomyces sp. NPDC102462]|uniref:N-acetylmuramoyl-L-alanine amidase n=1 Tax=Streptomyces sp. NPDC102462 TaxID=3366178 RepID=UPI0038070AEF